MLLSRSDNQVRIHTPAKLNLHLEVLGRRPDGFHEIETVMTTVSLFDTLDFAINSDQAIHLQCKRSLAIDNVSSRDCLEDWIPEGADNIVWKAVERFREWTGIRQGVRIRLIKRIPSQAGLGGASSDAAAALVAANTAWQAGLSSEELNRIAAELGSDVPFFLSSGPAIARGRGERITALDVRCRLAVVIVQPPVGLPTPDVYAHCEVATHPVPAEKIMAALALGQPRAIAATLMNRLQNAAAGLTPWIERLRTTMNRMQLLGHQMSGSGSSYFGICRHAGHARRVASNLRGLGIGQVFVTETIPTAPFPPRTANQS